MYRLLLDMSNMNTNDMNRSQLNKSDMTGLHKYKSNMTNLQLYNSRMSSLQKNKYSPQLGCTDNSDCTSLGHSYGCLLYKCTD